MDMMPVEEVIPMSLVQIPERVLKMANLVSRFTQDEMAQLLDLVPALQEVKPVSAQVEDDEIIFHFRQLAMEVSGGVMPSPQDEFLFGLTYEEYFNLSEEEAAALCDKAYAEESAKLDREPEHRVSSNAHVPSR
jgi:hypothetical protein